MSTVLYKKEMKKSLKLLIIFAAVLTMYIWMIIAMYDPEMADAIRQFETLMPELMAAVGMTGMKDSLEGFMCSYLYGMIMLVFPMVYSIIRANGLVAKHVDQGSMASLLSAPVKRVTVAFTQMCVLVSSVVFLLLYCTVLQYVIAQIMFPGELLLGQLLRLNIGLMALQLFISSFCFLCSCIFNESKYSAVVGAGIPVLMYVLQMLANMGGKLENIKYLTIFTLFDAEGLTASQGSAYLGAAVLFICAAVFYAGAIIVFNRKDLHL